MARFDRKRGKWIADVGTAKDGTRTRRSFEFKREAVAFERAATTKKETTGHFTPKRKSLTVVEAYQIWLDSRIHEAGCRKNTIMGYRKKGKSQLCVWAADEPEIPASKDRYGLARLALSELTEPIVQRWVDQLLREVSPSTVKYILTVLHGTIEYARRNGAHKGHNCVQPVRRWLIEQRHGIFRPHKPEVGIDIPTHADARAYLRAAAEKGLIHEAMELLKVHCGLRISEVRGLLWSDIELNSDRPVLHVRRVAERDGEITNYTKTQAGLRTIPLPDHIVDALRRWREVCPRRGSDGVSDTGRERAEEIARWLVANPTASDRQIAQQLRVSMEAVRSVRRRLGMPKWDYAIHRKKSSIVEPPEDSDCPPVDPSWFEDEGPIRSLPRAQKAAQYLWHNPQVQYAQLSEVLNVSRSYLAKIRGHLNLPKAKKGNRPPTLPLVAPNPNMERQLSLGGDEYLVFPSSDDTSKPLTLSCCWRWAVQIQLAANLKDTNNQPKYKSGQKYDYANHIWRHYFVTMLLGQRKHHWKEIANLSGHADATMVMMTYGHLVRDLGADYAMLSDAIEASMVPPKLRVVDAGEPGTAKAGGNLLGTKTADFGTSKR